MSTHEPLPLRRDAAYVVTGAGSGLDHAVTCRLLEEGCRVSAWDLGRGRLTGIADPNLAFHELDVRDKAAQERAAAETVRAMGGIAGTVAGAGIMTVAPFLAITEEAFDRTLAINLKGALFTVQAVLPHLRRARSGSIVLLSSSLARGAGPNAADYIASKGGILGLARTLALETATDGIRVNTISPGLADTPMPRRSRSETYIDALAAAHPMGRIATPAEIAEAVLFLLGDDASFVTGQDIRVDGGMRLY